ncbi:AVAST type 4 anti-phage nuclease Avs4 [Sulfurovum sp. CS9]|uniref:AVAST type 4 anti-phage nuclease Avs4 n=1 Tax=Sulfurovum sp. CS9 TaxID=3391146 RepID=UPI0039E81D4E
MIKSNWEIFKAKFSENPQNNFEWFCYLLFSQEHHQPYGIFRYKNQSAIETNPIEVNNEVIGWQAKFYDTSLSSHKGELLTTIEKAKRDYSNITKLIFYTNKEWGQYKGGKPKGLIEIEKKAKELNIILEWRTASYFESKFVSVENEIFSKHFFSLDKSFFDVVIEQQKHTGNILNQIQTSITYKGQYFEIDRSDDIQKIKDKSKQISILSGVGGVGKTVLIKKLYEQLTERIPFYVFKASEFELNRLNDLFSGFSFDNFIEAHKDLDSKIIVIDSSEKLLDLKNSDPFKEFLSVLIRENWKVIFTTRNHYLEDLNYQFFEIYNIAPLNININNLGLEELRTISEEQSFSLPKDEKLLELIRNPFYLNEYLKFYSETDDLNYSDFKTRLWIKNIKKSKPERERCFLQVALERANNGQFFISPNCESVILDELVKDGILGYEEAGYFITHDIYEEWALEKIIESEFIRKSSEQNFFNKIGQSLPIRRSFRNWISEKLLLEKDDIKTFIESVFESTEIEPFWKDEILVSILLSNYSKVFFEFFKDELLKNEQELLKRITFILRIACKEVDDDFFKQLGIKNLNLFSLKHVLTKPKGQGWESVIKFVDDNIGVIGIKNINFILPVAYDWNNKVREGETTRFSSLIALKLYQWIIKENTYYSRDNIQKDLFITILYGASEIKDELKDIFEEILKNKWKNHRDPYYDLSKFMLTKMEGISVSKVLPEYVLKFADLFWFYTQEKEDSSYHSDLDIEHYFGLEKYHFEYHPASAYQTPIYWLLQFSLKETVDFILEFTNKSIQQYASSNFDRTVQSVEVQIDNETTQKQHISHCLWNMYRGTSSPISPGLLQSIHMALEKYFLEIGKIVESSVLENWLLYLLRHSESASISSVVASVVLAYPDKTFNIAKILFKTKEFILQDTTRLVSDQSAKSLYSIGKNMGANTNEFYDEERIKTCDDKHRKSTLENIFLNYQYFRSEEVSDTESEKRQKELWDILDNYYKDLPPETKQTGSDKTWRLFLARMDKRKMNIATEKTDEGILIQFNPEIDSDLREYSEKSLATNSEFMKYSSLKIWADYKFHKNEQYKQYDQYESNPKFALKEVKDIIEKLNTINSPDYLKMQHSDDENFYLLNHSIPAYVCSVVLQDHIEELDEEEKLFCRDVILKISISSLQSDYRYQVSDGVQQAISLLPTLLKIFPENKEDIKIILLLSLFKEERVGGFLQDESFSIFSIMAIHKQWEESFNDAQSLLLGYLLLKPIYDELREKTRQENYNNGIYKSSNNHIMGKFLEENEENLQNIIECKLELNSIKDIDRFDLHTLKIAFQLIPQKTDNEDHKKVVKIITSAFANKILSDDSDEKIDYTTRHDFLKTYAYFVLNAPQDEIQDYLKPFLDNFNKSESIADLFKEFVSAEDYLNTYDNFWLVWDIFKEKIFEICKDGDGYWYVEEIIKSYLFAQVSWKKTTKDWHSLKDKNKKFFKEVSNTIGHCPSALYSISKLLNNIGSPYIDDGVIWISIMLDKNKDYVNKKLETNTIYYIENIVRKYTFKNREKIKKTKELKNNLIVILNFLIEKGSTIGYMLRESIV